MLCATDGCKQPTSGNSKYCREHKKIARQRFYQMVTEQAQKKLASDAELEQLFIRAEQAGYAAGIGHTPHPMVVQQHESVLDDNSPVEKSWYVPDGVCGFAWVIIRPGNCAAANYAKKHLGASRSYYGGMQISVWQFNQSYEKKMTYATTFAKVLSEAGINAYADGRLD